MKIMTQEDKDLLIRDLGSRLNTKLVCSIYRTDDQGIGYRDEILHGYCNGDRWYEFYFEEDCSIGIDNVSKIKPYLFPLSSMTEEQEKEWRYTLSSDGNITYETVDWLNKNHFDYRGLIEKGLAKDATSLNIYQSCSLMKVKCKYRTPSLNNPQITIGTKIRLKANPDVILSIISNDCHEDKFECSNGSVLSLEKIKKYYDII